MLDYYLPACKFPIDAKYYVYRMLANSWVDIWLWTVVLQTHDSRCGSWVYESWYWGDYRDNKLESHFRTIHQFLYGGSDDYR